MYNQQFMSKNLKLEDYKHDGWFTEEELDDIEALENYEEVREGKEIKNLTQNELLTILPILLAQLKAGNNSYKLKNEIRQTLYFLYQHNNITKAIYKNLTESL